MTQFLILALLLALFLSVGYYNVRLVKRKRLTFAAMVTPLSFTLLTINLILIFFVIDEGTYERLTKEHAVATITFESVRPKTFRTTINPAFSHPLNVELNGDQWQLDARLFKWTGPGAYLGLQPVYVLERISGRFQNVREEISQPKSAHSLEENGSFSYWNLLVKYQHLIPWLDSYYGNAVYLPMEDKATFVITIGQQGLIARPRNFAASQAVKNWTAPENNSVVSLPRASEH